MAVRLIVLFASESEERTRVKNARDGMGTVLAVETALGRRLLDSPYHPHDEAKQLIEDEVRDKTRLLILGCGSGYLPEAAAEHGPSEILALTGSPTAARRTVERLNRLPHSCKVTVLVTDTAETAWQEGVLPFLLNGPAPGIIHNPREFAAFPGLLYGVALRLERWKDRETAKPHRPPQRVLFPTSGGLLEQELISELKLSGVDVVTVPPYSETHLTPENAWRELKRHRPDFVLSTANQGSDRLGLIPEACEQLGVPWATWFLDDPEYILTPEEIYGVARDRWGFHWDRNGIDSWRRMGFTRGFVLPLATDPKLFFPREGDPSLTGRIVFVGSPRFARAAGYFASFERDPSVQAVVDAFAPGVIRSRRPPVRSVLEEMLDTLKLVEKLRGETLRRLPAYIVQTANLRYRREMLAAIAHLRPIVYGNGWEGLLPDTVELRGLADYDRDLPVIYASDAVHLSLTNLQMRMYPNQRVFDAGACGGVVVGEALEGWEELFGRKLNELLFRDKPGMIDRLASLAADRAARKRLGEKLREIVLAKHTIRHRLERIMAVVFNGYT